MQRFKLFIEATPSIEDKPDPMANPKAGYTDSGKETDQSITGVDPDDATEDEIEKQEDVEDEEDAKEETRLLGIDKRSMNKEFKELCKNPVPALPLKAVTGILASNNLKLVDEDGVDAVFEFTGIDGGMDYDLVEIDSGKHINNSMGIMQWHKNDDQTYNFNFYLG